MSRLLTPNRVRSTPLVAGVALLCSGLHVENTEAATPEKPAKPSQRHSGTSSGTNKPGTHAATDHAAATHDTSAQPLNGPLSGGQHASEPGEEHITVVGSRMNILHEDIGLSRMLPTSCTHRRP